MSCKTRIGVVRLGAIIGIAALASSAAAAVKTVVVTSRTPWLGGRAFGQAGPYEKLQGRILFAVDPEEKANSRVADIRLAPRDAAGLVEFTSDFVVLRPVTFSASQPKVLLEILNRGHSQANGVFFSSPSGGAFKIENLDKATLNDAFAFEHGFTIAWLGWQFDLAPDTVRLQAPIAADGMVREAFVSHDDEVSSGVDPLNTPGSYCAIDAAQPSATLTVKDHFEGPHETIPRTTWSFARLVDGKLVSDPCSIYLPGGFSRGRMYEAIYQGAPAPVAGLGLAAVRDFVSYLKYGGVGSALLKPASKSPRVLGYGYSQSARFLRQYLYQGFTADERGRKTFDGLFIASAGAGRGSFNHRYAQPGQAGVSVLSDLRPVDLFPFTDGDEFDSLTGERDGLLDEAKQSHTLPKIFYTFSSSEYWARAGSLTYTTVDGSRELPISADARLYFFAGTPHAHGRFPPDRGASKGPAYSNLVNFSSSKWSFRALLIDLDNWVAEGREPPASVYPHVNTDLVKVENVSFPRVPDLVFPTAAERPWRLDFGARFKAGGVIDQEPPRLGARYAVLVPQVDADGNDEGGIALPFLAVPLGTFTGWNRDLNAPAGFDYLAGLIGGFSPFPKTKTERLRTNDPRLSIEERYSGRDAYLARIRAADLNLVRRRLLIDDDLPGIEQESLTRWDTLTENESNLTVKP